MTKGNDTRLKNKKTVVAPPTTLLAPTVAMGRVVVRRSYHRPGGAGSGGSSRRLSLTGGGFTRRRRRRQGSAEMRRSSGGGGLTTRGMTTASVATAPLAQAELVLTIRAEIKEGHVGQATAARGETETIETACCTVPITTVTMKAGKAKAQLGERGAAVLIERRRQRQRRGEEAMPPLADCPFPTGGPLLPLPRAGSIFSTPGRVSCSGSGLRVKSPSAAAAHIWGICYV